MANMHPLSELDIQVTSKAVDRLKKYLQSKKEMASGVRLGVKRTGCSGYAYVVELEDAPEFDDTVYAHENIPFYINPFAQSILAGSTLDFVKSGLNEKFIFLNPNETGACGCGESFTFK